MECVACPYVPSPQIIVSYMLHMAKVTPKDYVIDLGSGDGRIVIEAARRGARGMGVDIDPDLVAAANENAKRAGVADRAKFIQQDIFETDLSPASVVTMYLLPEFNRKLLPRLLALRPGTRIVSHDYRLHGREFEQCLRLDLDEKIAVTGEPTTRVLLYRTPLRLLSQPSGLAS
jgi:16S rRNA G966 N2-methylase RsmD